MMLTESQVQQRTVILYPDEDNYWVVEVPSLPGCISQGETKEEALTNIQEAIALYLEVLEERWQVIRQANLSIDQFIELL
jgi:predicted RNase H-like HicB family nuclease